MEKDLAPTVLIPGFTFTEGPRWHENRIWFSDLYTFHVHSAREDGSDLRVEATVPEQPSGLGWLPDGRLLVVSMLDRKLMRREPDGTLVTHADLNGHAAGYLGDVVVDSFGRAYLGNFGFDLYGNEPMRPTSLHRVDPDGEIVEVAQDLWFPNGCVVTHDNVLLVNETFGNRVTAFDITPDGDLTNRRVWAEFGPLPTARFADEALKQVDIAPDGACLDAEGGLWIADIKSDRLLRVLQGGVVSDEIRPGTGVFACTLGGSDGRTLFVCATPDFDVEARKASCESSIRTVRVTAPVAQASSH
jgi:sugar lactone lactonase YvrE